MSETKKLDLYEDILINILRSVNLKLYDISILYKNNGSRHNIFFLTIITQEELSKLIILPLIKECDDLVNFLSNKKNNPFYKHSTKQKIFSTFGIIEKNFEDIERIKQNCLYVGIKENGECQYVGEGITKEVCLLEIKSSLLTYENLLNNIIKFGNLSETANKMIFILIASMKDIFDNIDGIYEILKKERDDIKNGIGKTKDDIENHIRNMFIKNPYEWINYVKKYLLKKYGKEEYKNQIKNMIHMSRSELILYLYKIIK